jgi:hypothetical protein
MHVVNAPTCDNAVIMQFVNAAPASRALLDGRATPPAPGRPPRLADRRPP